MRRILHQQLESERYWRTASGQFGTLPLGNKLGAIFLGERE